MALSLKLMSSLTWNAIHYQKQYRKASIDIHAKYNDFVGTSQRISVFSSCCTICFDLRNLSRHMFGPICQHGAQLPSSYGEKSSGFLDVFVYCMSGPTRLIYLEPECARARITYIASWRSWCTYMRVNRFGWTSIHEEPEKHGHATSTCEP